MRRIWVFLKESTVEVIVRILKSYVIRNHERGKRFHADETDNAAEDLKRAKRLTDTGVSRDEIEHASRKYDRRDGDDE